MLFISDDFFAAQGVVVVIFGLFVVGSSGGTVTALLDAAHDNNDQDN